jgi:glyoxylase-like metal-dependent hydrolase (beta-lactamase superfamily II)
MATWTPFAKRWTSLAAIIAAGGLLMALARYLEHPTGPQSTKPIALTTPMTRPGDPAKSGNDARASISGKPRDPARIAEINKIKDSLFLITNGGGNTLAFVTAKGVLLVDTKFDGWGPTIADKIRSVTQKSVTTIVDSNPSVDHTGSNDFFVPGAEIIAQENTRANMARLALFQGDRARALPKRTYADKMSLFDGKERVELRHLGVGTTNGDTVVVFPELRVAYLGDLFPGKMLPAIDTANGGSGVALPETLERIVSEIKDIDIFVTGHGAPMTPSDVRDYARFNKDFLSAVQKAAKNGKTTDQIAAEWTLPDKHRTYMVDPTRLRANIKSIVDELKLESKSKPKQ